MSLPEYSPWAFCLEAPSAANHIPGALLWGDRVEPVPEDGTCVWCGKAIVWEWGMRRYELRRLLIEEEPG